MPDFPDSGFSGRGIERVRHFAESAFFRRVALGRMRRFVTLTFLRRQTRGGVTGFPDSGVSVRAIRGYLISGFPIFGKTDAEGSYRCGGFRYFAKADAGGGAGADSLIQVFRAGRRWTILGITEGLTSGVVIFPNSGFFTSASSGRPQLYRGGIQKTNSLLDTPVNHSVSQE